MSKTVIYALRLPDDLDPHTAVIFAGPVSEPLGLKLNEVSSRVVFDTSADTGQALIRLIARGTTAGKHWLRRPSREPLTVPGLPGGGFYEGCFVEEWVDPAQPELRRWVVRLGLNCLDRTADPGKLGAWSIPSAETMSDYLFDSVTKALEAAERAGVPSLENETLAEWQAREPE